MPQDRSGKAGLPTPDSGPGAEGRERFSGRCKTARAPGRVVSSGLTRGRRAAGKKGRQTPITPLRLGRCDSSRSGSRVEGAELSQALRCPAPPQRVSADPGKTGACWGEREDPRGTGRSSCTLWLLLGAPARRTDRQRHCRTAEGLAPAEALGPPCPLLGGPSSCGLFPGCSRPQPHAAASSALPPAAVPQDRPWPRGGQHSQRPGLPWGHRASHPPCDRPSRAAGSVPETSLLPSEGSEGLERLVGAGPGACRGTVLAGPGCPQHRESRAGTPSPP